MTPHSSIHQLMSKRRRGNRRTHYQVPSLQALAAQAVRRIPHGYSQASAGLRRSLFGMSDSAMSGPSSSTSTQTSNKRARTDAADGAQEAGQGLMVTVPRSVPHCYNNNYTVKLSYADNFRHDVNYGNPARQVFRTNSIFDPDFTGTGHQPMFRDLWASMYDHYTVLACDIELHFYNGSVDTLTWTSTGTANNRLGCVQVHTLATTNSDDYVTSAAVFPIAEMKNVATNFLTPEDTLAVQRTLTPGDFIVDAKDADSDNTWVAVGSNPGVPRFFGYCITSTQWAAIPGQNKTPFTAIQVFAKLNYTVQFTQVAASLRQAAS